MTTPTPAALTSASGEALIAVFHPDYGKRALLFDFLELSYNGGMEYKYGRDSQGQPTLIEHENESAPVFSSDSLYSRMNQAASEADGGPGMTAETALMSKFERRRRAAAYENHVAPIIDKIAAYLCRGEPHRAESLRAEFDRLEIGRYIESMIHAGLKFSESWIGFDAASITPVENLPMTEAVVAEQDPKHRGKPYLVEMDPRRIVDWDEQIDGTITRVVIEELHSIKASFTSPVRKLTTYTEWTATSWTRYEAIEDDNSSELGVKLKVVATRPHTFGMCPWFRFRPKFPTKDVAEVNRLLFNNEALLNEELFNNTFTQRWVTGVRTEDIGKMSRGSGNVWVFDDPLTKVGTFEAVPGHAQELRARSQELREQIYTLVSLNATTTKNVAEAAEKKKRDLESLYTLLVEITKAVERIENRLLGAMGLFDDSSDKQTTYDKKFDVLSLEDLLDQLARLKDVPFVPSSFKRRFTGQLLTKLEPFGDHEVYASEIETIADISASNIDAVTTAVQANLLTPEIAVRQIGIPEADQPAVIELMRGHRDADRGDFSKTPEDEDDEVVPTGDNDTGDSEGEPDSDDDEEETGTGGSDEAPGATGGGDEG